MKVNPHLARVDWLSTRFALLLVALGVVFISLQAQAAPRTRIDSGVDYVGDLLADPRGALSINGNIAGIAALDSAETRLQLSFGQRSVDGSAGNGWGLYALRPLGPLRFAASVERVGRADGDAGQDPGLLAVSRLGLGMAFRLRNSLHLGLSAKVLSRQRSWPWALSAGAMWRPWSWISLAASVDTLTSTPVATGQPSIFRPRWGGGVAIRPIAGSSRLTLAADWRWNGGDRDISTRLGVNARVVDGLGVSAQLTRAVAEDPISGSRQAETRLGIMLQLGFGAFGVDTSVRSDQSHEAQFGGDGWGAQLGLRWSADAPPSLTRVGQRAVVVPLNAKAIAADERSGAFMRLLLRLRRLADNPLTELVVFRSEGAKWTWSQVDEMHGAIARLHRAGKRTAWYGASVGTRGYAVAAMCGKIGMPEAGSVQVQGVGVDFVGLADALTLVGARVDAIRFEAHKSAPEAFTRRRISKELKATYRRIIDARWRHFMNIVSKGRDLSADRVERALRRGAVAPRAAKAAALIDAVAEPIAFEKLLRKWNWLASDASLQPLRLQRRRRTRWGARPRVAVVTVDGMIVDGRTSKGLSGAQTGGAQTARLLSGLGGAPNVAGVVLRLNTGGGAVWGSDAMFHAARGLSRRKPIVASMASMAASGGYWTALGADMIFANRSTITGSIGIWIAKPDLSDALGRLHVGVDRVSKGPWPFVNSIKSGWSPTEKLMIRRSLKRYYDLFLSRVAKRRSLSLRALGPLAGGRLWLGDSARRHQLVDRNGGFLDAMDYLTGRMNLAETPRIDFFPKRSLSERVRSLIFGVTSPQIEQIRSLVGPWLDRVAVLAALPRSQPLAITPVQLQSPEP